jgi:pimeloyl-ACP methyl ester carboxylesterase
VIAALAAGETRYQTSGEGPARLFIHGLGMDLTMWDPLLRHLETAGRDVRYDTIGHGESTKPTGPYSLQLYARQAIELLDHLEIGSATIIGFSLGGLIAMAIGALYRDRVDGIAILNAVHRRTPAEQDAVELRVEQVRGGGPAATVDAALDRWFTQPFKQDNPELVEHVRRTILRNDPEAYLAAYQVFAQGGVEFHAELDRISRPALVATGEDDIGSTPLMSRRMAAALSGDVVIWPKLRHLPPMEDPGIVARTLDVFFRATSASGEALKASIGNL